MKTLVIPAVAALALGLAAGTASAAQPVDKSAARIQAPDGFVQNEEDRGRRWMRTWQDQERDQRQAPVERNWGDRRWGDQGGVRGKTSGDSDDQRPTDRSWRGDDDRGTQRPKPRD